MYICTYIFECYGLLDLEGQLSLELILLIKLAVDRLAVEVDLVVRVGEHLAVDLLGVGRHLLAYDAPELLGEVRGRVVGLDHHEVVRLEVHLEYEDEAHLRLGRQQLDRVLHQHVLLGLLLAGDLGIGRHPLDHHLHLQLLDRVLLTRVHQGEEHAELLPRADLPEGRVVVEGRVPLHAVIADVVRRLQEVSLGVVQLLLGRQGNDAEQRGRRGVVLRGLVEGCELVLELGLRQPLNRCRQELVKLDIHHYYYSN